MKTPSQRKNAAGIFWISSFFLFCFQVQAQCPSGYTSGSINWDYQYFDTTSLPGSGINFMIGINSMRLSWTGNNTFEGTTDIHTGDGSSKGSGNDLFFDVGNGADTMVFVDEVENLAFSIYDLDNNQKVTITAKNESDNSVSITTLSKTSHSILSISGSGSSTASATANSTNVPLSGTKATANVYIKGPVKTVILTFTKSSATDSVFISDISACINGTWTTNYQATSSPETGQSSYLLASYGDSSIYTINRTTQVATRLYTDPYIKEMNSVACDPYNQVIYFVSNTLTRNNKTIYKYNVRTGTRSVFISNVNTLGMQTFSGGLGSAGAAFYNGCLFIGQEDYAEGEPFSIWRIDLDDNGNALRASRVWSKLGDDGNSIYNWGDFVINNGVLYDFNVAADAASNTNIEHIDLNSQTVTDGYTVSGLSQTSIDHTGTIYSMTANHYAAYDGSGSVGSATTYTGVTPGAIIIDGSESFKFPYDFGDAPSTYGCAYHLYNLSSTKKLRLGNKEDYETNDTTNMTASADDDYVTDSGNDEDGVTTLDRLSTDMYSWSDTLKVTNTTGSNAYLYGWIDLNLDGDFNDEGERSARTVIPNNATSAIVTWTGINTSSAGSSFVRFRIGSEEPDVESPSGYAQDGEVEDYPIIIYGSTLPVELSAFTGKEQEDHTILLNWSTASESNNAYFEIQRSTDGENWTVLGDVQGHGNSHQPINYNFTDNNPYLGINYYRLKQVDYDGRFNYSSTIYLKIESLSITLKEDWMIYPNPVGQELWIKSTNNTEMKPALPVAIYNSIGTQVYRGNLDQTAMSVDVSDYPNGIYLVRVGDKTYKVVKE